MRFNIKQKVSLWIGFLISLCLSVRESLVDLLPHAAYGFRRVEMHGIYLRVGLVLIATVWAVLLFHKPAAHKGDEKESDDHD